MFSLFKPVLKIIASALPRYQTRGSACFDISITTSKTLLPNELHNFSTGLRMEIPDGWCLLVFPRSSLGQRKCIIPNSVGVIDSDYRGEIKVPILNLSSDGVYFYSGQRVAQGLLVKAMQCKIKSASRLSDTIRGNGGFGSTGE